MDRSLQVSCLIATLLLQINEAHAQGTDVVNVPAGNDVIVPVKKGEPAPVDGQLFDNDTALRWANWLVQYKQLLKTKVEFQKKICAIDVDLGQQKLQIEQEKNTKVVTDLETKLQKAQEEAASPPFYRTFWFGAAIGVSTTVLVTVAAAMALDSSR